MKKIFIYFIALFLGLTACEDELNQVPLSDLSVDGFFRNENDFEQAVNGIYQSLRGYPARGFHLSDVRSDNIYGVGSAGVRDHEPVNNFALTLATNNYMEEAWNANFEGIMRANTLLENINEEAVPDETLRKRFEAEAKFLRAVYYFDLVKWFGKVPLIEKITTPEEALEIGRSAVSDVYGLIIPDLQFAIQNLPPSYSGSDVGRATSYAAMGILARVYLTRSGPVMHPEGPCLGTNEYTQAIGLLNDIIGSPNYALLDSFSLVFANNNENNAEVIFDIQFQSGGLGIGADYPGELAGRGWWNSVGIPWAIGLETKDVSQEMINSFETGDERFAVSVQEEYIDVSSGDTLYDPTCIKYATDDPAYWGADRFDFPINYIVLRYADVLLMKAECILQGASGTQAEVNQIVNDIRNRAGLLSLAGDASLDDLLEERRREFLGEGLRWHDLVRTGKVLETMNAWIPTVDVTKQMRYPITSSHIIYPVPQDQIDVKKGLYEQNDDYN